MLASSQSWLWFWSTPTYYADPSTTLSSSSSSTSSFLYSFHIPSVKRRRFVACSLQQHHSSSSSSSFDTPSTKRRRFVAWSLQDHSSSSSSSSSSTTSNSGPTLSKPVQLRVSGSNGEKLRSRTKDKEEERKEVPSTRLTQNPTRKREARSFKSLFGKRSLWRRILFASRKVRSIILLNVITLIYGSRS